MVRQSDRERDSGICLRRTNEPVGELRVPAGDDRVELRGVGVREGTSGLELRSMVLVEQVSRDAAPDGVCERGPLPGDLQLLRSSTVGDRTHLGEVGEIPCGSKRWWRRSTELALRREEEGSRAESATNDWCTAADPEALADRRRP